MTATDYAALLARIIATPADDAPRLIAADWLTEHEADVTCGECNGKGTRLLREAGTRGINGRCSGCRGTGFVSNGLAARAELIRVQVELAELDAGRIVNAAGEICGFKRKKDRDRHDLLSSRSRELLPAHGEKWEDDELLRPCGLLENENGTEYLRDEVAAMAWTWSRGYINKIGCSTATLLGGRCETCRSHGDRSDASICRVCNGSGRTPGIAAAVGRAVPVQAVVLTDREPYTLRGLNGPYWHWYDTEQVSERPHPQSNVPAEIFTLIDLPQEYHYKYVDSEAAARAALAKAAAEYCRQQAKESA